MTQTVRHRRRCGQCNRLVDPDYISIESFLEFGVEEPPSRATKDELSAHIEKLTRLLVTLRGLMLSTYYRQLHSTEEFNKDLNEGKR